MDFSDKPYFINRELSWLEFNQRVLDQALDDPIPILERLKFLCIVSSNLDEFFEVRVAGIKQQKQTLSSEVGPDGLIANRGACGYQRTRSQAGGRPVCLLERRSAAQSRSTENTVPSIPRCAGGRAGAFPKFFRKEVFPVLTPLAIDPAIPSRNS